MRSSEISILLGIVLLEYDMGGYYFVVDVSEGHVRNWGVSSYSREFPHNHPALT